MYKNVQWLAVTPPKRNGFHFQLSIKTQRTLTLNRAVWWLYIFLICMGWKGVRIADSLMHSLKQHLQSTVSPLHSLQARGLNPRPSCCEATVLLHRCVAVMTSYEPLYFVSLWNLWCLFLNKGAKFVLIFLSIFCPLHAFSHEGIEQGTIWPVKDQRKSSSAHKGPFGHLLTGEGSSTAVMTVPQAPPGSTRLFRL